MSKRKKIIIIISSIIALLLILFAPIPKTEKLDNGKALSLTSLTYKIVIWDMYKGSEKPYTQTEFLILPKNFKSTETLWEEKYQKIQDDNYGKVKTTIIGESPQSNNSNTTHTNNSASQEVVSSKISQPESTASSVPDSSVSDSSNDNLSSNSSTQDVYNQKYNHNIFSEQTLIKDTYFDDISGYSLPYTIIMPYEYDENIKYPVILYLHGAGYLGSDNTSQYTPIQKTFFYNYKWLNNAIIISPQTADWWNYDQYNESGNLNAVMRLFNKITAEYPCDSSRYYVTGGSMGGYGTWQIALNCSDVFAAAMPLCGWWNPSDADKLCDIPIYILHGLADTTVSPHNATEMYDAIIAAGGNKVKIKLYEGVEHDVWRSAYTDAEILDWLFAQKKQ